jgi:hypothetical protein
MLIDQIIPHLPKYNEEVNTHVKCLQAMLDAATEADPVHDQEDEDQGHKDDHRHSPHGDSASSFTPSKERGHGHGRDNRDLHDVIRGRVAWGRIENRRRDQEHDEREQRDERDYDYYGPYYDQPHRQRSPKEGHVLRGVKAYSRDMTRVHWPLNFKTLRIEKYDGSTNPSEWLEVYQLTIEAIGGDSYVMAYYLPVCLSATARTWLLGLPTL